MEASGAGGGGDDPAVRAPARSVARTATGDRRSDDRPLRDPSVAASLPGLQRRACYTRRKDIEETAMTGAAPAPLRLLRLGQLTGEPTYERQSASVLRLLHEIARATRTRAGPAAGPGTWNFAPPTIACRSAPRAVAEDGVPEIAARSATPAPAVAEGRRPLQVDQARGSTGSGRAATRDCTRESYHLPLDLDPRSGETCAPRACRRTSSDSQ